MGTRCQVQVCGSDGDKVTLYHHFDGYPTNMLPLFQRAFDMTGGGWSAARGGKAASFLCAADPGGFEPEEGHKLHGDIEWYYRIHAKGEMHAGAKPVWEVEVFDVPGWDVTPDKLALVWSGPLKDANPEEIESSARAQS